MAIPNWKWIYQEASRKIGSQLDSIQLCVMRALGETYTMAKVSFRWLFISITIQSVYVQILCDTTCAYLIQRYIKGPGTKSGS